MRRIVFLGPSLPDAPPRAGIERLAPARCGDIARAVAAGAGAIGLVDGLFETTRSTWHKEILWALSRGVPVLGAASMGALRAAELHAFGMVGVGRVFAAFRDGILEDDDEVAVSHGPAAFGFRPLSDAMVNIRATLERATRRGVISAGTHAQLVEIGKRLFFKQRSFEAMLAGGASARVSHAELTRLRHWLPQHAVDVKRADARALLRALHGVRRPTGPRPHFVSSRHWENLVSELGLRSRRAIRRRGADA